MFGRKGTGPEAPNAAQTPATTTPAKAETANYGSPAKAAEPASLTARPATPMPSRRVIDIPGRRSSAQDVMNQETRKLTVGREITLTGEIATCDILVVEGQVSATLRDGRLIEIAEAGMFHGTVEIDNADIAGKFEGDLIVHNRLTVRASGRITGRVQYGELEVQAGGQIIGEMQAVKQAAPAQTQTQPQAQTGGFKDAAKATSTFEDEAQDATRARAAV